MTAADSKRLTSLDFLRGIASFGVCWFHLCYFTYPTADDNFYHLLRLTGKYGWLGVQVFFVISGFVIPYSLYNSGYRLKHFPTFMLKRVVRLDPPYVVTILLTIFLGLAYTILTGHRFEVEGAPVSTVRVLLHFAYLNVFFGYVWLNPVFWTLAIEFQYYILAGLTFPLLVSLKLRTRIISLVVLSAVCLAGRYKVSHGVRFDAFIFHFLFLFQMGIATFQYVVGIIRKKEFLIVLSAAILGCLVTLGFAQTMAGVFAVTCALLYRRRNFVSDFLGRISYSLYLLHWPVGHVFLSVVGAKLLHAQTGLARLAVLLMATAVTLASSALLYFTVERPSQAWSSRIRYRVDRRLMDQIIPETAGEGVVAEPVAAVTGSAP